MDLTDVNGLGPARRDKLVEAGIDSIEALAGIDPAQLAEDVDIPKGTLEGFREQAQELSTLADLDEISTDEFEALVEAGIRSPEQLTEADATELSSSAGIDAKTIETWQRSLEESGVSEAAREMAEGAREAGEIAAESLDQARVVLQEGVNDARVKFEEDVLSEARILPIKAKEDVDERLEKLKGDVVVLREEADTALVRVGDQVVEGIPIFKQKVSEAGQSVAEGAEEVRVRVQEVRDKRVLPEANKISEKIKGLFDRS